nr:1288_t:CDS:2 [Entrophospora candida]
MVWSISITSKEISLDNDSIRYGDNVGDDNAEDIENVKDTIMERKVFLDEPTLYTERKNGKLGSLPELCKRITIRIIGDEDIAEKCKTS